MANLTALLNFLIYSDPERTNNPRLRDVDYKRMFTGIPAGNYDSRKIVVQPGSTVTVAQTNRTTTFGVSTVFTVANASDSTYLNRFRYVYVSGTGPGFRTRRSTSVDSTTQFNVTKNGSLITFAHSGTGTAPNFASVTVGDYLTVERGGPFNDANVGVFQVVAVPSSTSVTVKNADGYAENSITLGSNIDGLYMPFDIYSASGVQINDEVRITASVFNPENRGTFKVLGITPSYFEIENNNPGISESGLTIGDSLGFVFYPNIYEWVYLEANQDLIVRFNEDTASTAMKLVTITPNDDSATSVFLGRIETYRIEVYNNGTSEAYLKFVLSE